MLPSRSISVRAGAELFFLNLALPACCLLSTPVLAAPGSHSAESHSGVTAAVPVPGQGPQAHARKKTGSGNSQGPAAESPLSRKGGTSGISGTEDGNQAASGGSGSQPPAGSHLPQRGYLGVTLAEICPEVRAQTTLREGEGLLIGRVAPGSPAALLGLRHYDILTRLNDQWLMTPAQFATLVENAGPDVVVELTYLRRGTEVKAAVKLGRKPEIPVPSASVPPSTEEMLTTVIRTLRDNPEMLQAVHRMLHLPADGTLPSPGTRLTLSDEEGEMELTVAGTTQHIKAWDSGGRLIFEGTCAGSHDIANLPESLKPRVELLLRKCHHKDVLPLPASGTTPSPADSAEKPPGH